MPTMSTSAGSVAYDSRGSGDPIVLLPGGGHDHHDYDEIRELLPGRFRSIGIDWPGHGRSPAGTAPVTEPRLAQIVEELLDSLTPGGAVLVVIESGHLPRTTSPAAVAAELISLANSAFDSDSRTSDTPHSPTAGKEQ
jgi:Alpha/beta hydrolase family